MHQLSDLKINCPKPFKNKHGKFLIKLKNKTACIVSFIKGKDKKNLNYKNLYPNSLGLLYSAITFYLGWKPFCDEGIIMGLAPYGNSQAKIKGTNKTYYDLFKDIICLNKNNPLQYHL